MTVELTLFALLFASVVGITLGLLSATRRNSPVDVGTMVVANLGVSTPVFVLGLFLAFVFAVLLKDTPFALPPSGRLSPGVNVTPLAEAWGLRGADRARRGRSSTSSRTCTWSTRSHRPVGARSSTRSGT